MNENSMNIPRVPPMFPTKDMALTMKYSFMTNFTGRVDLRSHSASLFTGQECPKISMTSNPRQNCRIGQPFTKKCFFSPDQLGLRRKRKGKSGEIRSLPETLGSTL